MKETINQSCNILETGTCRDNGRYGRSGARSATIPINPHLRANIPPISRYMYNFPKYNKNHVPSISNYKTHPLNKYCKYIHT